MVFDLSVDSPLISGDPSENSEPKLTERLFSAMDAAGVNNGIGRYDEPRLFYLSSIFTAAGEPRVIHLELIYLQKQAHRFLHLSMEWLKRSNNNAAPQDYGPMIILRHVTDDGTSFYTVYGHLSLASLNDYMLEKKIAKEKGSPL